MYGNILISVTEAVNNGILHGNKGDESKMVHVETVVDDKKRRVSFIVKDEGEGFEYNNLPDPTAPENLEKMSGRGIFIIKQLSDLVVFSDEGRCIEMQFSI
jgi:serine/threonine-protein kinase RsbW